MHQAIGGSVAFCFLAYAERDRVEKTLLPVVGAAGVAALSKLPDLVEPALHPNHRQFFHSVAFAAALGVCAKSIYDWRPTDTWAKALRGFLLIALAAYLIHLASDFFTARSLPLVGRL
jgi:membrane-bound metal-dependent hydrolase YbcI (DUF457 family)